MSNYTATVIKTGNSYALRVPKKYMEDTRLQKGDKVVLGKPLSGQAYNPDAFWQTAERLASRPKGPRGYAAMSVEDVIKWQREIRKDRPLPGRD